MTATLAQFSQWLSPYYSELSLMLMATILVVYGDVVNKYAKSLVSSWHFVFRTVTFVLLCAFGYGLMTLYGAPFLLHIIKYLPWHLQGVGIVSAFILIGILAEKRRYM